MSRQEGAHLSRNKVGPGWPRPITLWPPRSMLVMAGAEHLCQGGQTTAGRAEAVLQQGPHPHKPSLTAHRLGRLALERRLPQRRRHLQHLEDALSAAVA